MEETDKEVIELLRQLKRLDEEIKAKIEAFKEFMQRKNPFTI